MDIKQLIGEATDYDKKVALEIKKPKSWCKSVSAFANCYGGKLVFGVANDDALVGLSDAEGDAEKISEIIKTHLNPIPEFKLSFATVYKGNIIKNLIMDCQSYTKYRPNETTGGIFVSWRRKEELPTGA